MKLVSFRVTKFRNIVDSGIVKTDPGVTCLVGKNEAGKSGLLEALYLFNPAYADDSFDVNEQYPRWLVVSDRRAGNLDEHTPISVTFELGADDVDAVDSVLGDGAMKSNKITVARKYGSGTAWTIKWDETAVITSLKADIPKGVRPLLKDAKTTEAIRDVVRALKPGEDGTAPTAEDIAAANDALTTRGLEKVDGWHRVVNLLKPRLPKFFRFTSYNTLPGRIDFQEIVTSEEVGPGRSGLQTARALLKLAGTDLTQLGDDDYELRKGELEAVQIDLTNQVFEYWKQNPSLEVLIDVDKETVKQDKNTTAVARFLEIRLRDKRTGYSNNFSQRSSGFQWFFSFLAAFSEFEGQESPIVLLDEPALTLHGKAQADFLRFINDRLAPSSPVLYTTHSPFMVEADRLDRVRIVEDHGPPEGAVAHADVLASDPDSLFPLHAALGYDIAQNLFVGPHNLVVEGTSDFIYLTVMSALCVESGRVGLDERWRVLPAGGATNIPTFVSLIGPHLDITVLADSDTKGMKRVTNMIEKQLLAAQRLIMVSDVIEAANADTEDLFSVGDYLKIYNKRYGTTLKVGGLPEGDRIVKRIETMREPYRHGEVAETLLRHQHEMSFTDTSLDQFAAVIAAINKTMDSPDQ